MRVPTKPAATAERTRRRAPSRRRGRENGAMAQRSQRCRDRSTLASHPNTSHHSRAQIEDGLRIPRNRGLRLEGGDGLLVSSHSCRCAKC